MSAISTILAKLRSAIWAIDVRDDIADAIEQCYSDVSNPTLQTEALEEAIQAKIDEGKMAELAIGDGTITAAKLAVNAVTTPKIADGSITQAKLDPNIDFVQVDDTLSNEGEAADAAAVGAAIDELNGSLVDIKNLVYTDYASVSTASTQANVVLSGTGGIASDNTCEIRKYSVVSGDILHLICAADATYTYQWSKGTTVNAANLVGTPVQGAVDEYVIVPKYATYLFISCKKTNTTTKVYKSSGNTFSYDALSILFKLLSLGTYTDDVRLQLRALKSTLGYIDKTETRTLLRDWQFYADDPLTSKDESETTITASNTVSFSDEGAVMPSSDIGAATKLHGIQLLTSETGITLSGVSVVIDLGEVYAEPQNGYYYKLLCIPQTSSTAQMFGYVQNYGGNTGWISKESGVTRSLLNIADINLLNNKTLEVKFGANGDVKLYVNGALFFEDADNLYSASGLILGTNRSSALPITIRRVRIYQD